MNNKIVYTSAPASARKNIFFLAVCIFIIGSRYFSNFEDKLSIIIPVSIFCVLFCALGFHIASCEIQFFNDNLQVGFFPSAKFQVKNFLYKSIISVSIERIGRPGFPPSFLIEFLKENGKKKFVRYGHSFNSKEIEEIKSLLKSKGVNVLE